MLARRRLTRNIAALIALTGCTREFPAGATDAHAFELVVTPGLECPSFENGFRGSRIAIWGVRYSESCAAFS